MSEKQATDHAAVRPVTPRHRSTATRSARESKAARTQRRRPSANMKPEQVEELAAEILAKTGLRRPVDALILADCFGLRLIPSGEDSFDGHELKFNVNATYRERQHFIACCAARWALAGVVRARYDWVGHKPSKPAVERLSRALMIPREQLLADLDVLSNRGMEWVQRQYCTSEAMIRARLSDVGISIDTLVADPPPPDPRRTALLHVLKFMGARQHLPRLNLQELSDLGDWVADGNPDDVDSLEIELLTRRRSAQPQA